MFDDKTNNILRSLEKTQKEFWNIDIETATFLNMLIKTQKTKNALELGTSNGYSGIWLAKALKETDGYLTTIEFWDKRQNVAIENFKICDVNDIITTKLGSACDILLQMQKEIFDNRKEKFDFVFIDANKLEYIKYFELIDPILVNGGLILADNINSHRKKVQPYLDAILNRENYQNVLLNFEAGLLMSRKID